MESPNFKASEFRCKCGCGVKVKYNLALLIILEDVRAHFKSIVDISSATRCWTHNQNVGGANNSKHVTGDAVDISVKGVSAQQVYDYVNTQVYGQFLGLGLYVNKGFVHVDTRGHAVRFYR